MVFWPTAAKTTCRELLGLCPDHPEVPPETMQERMLRLTGVDPTECPCCKRGHIGKTGPGDLIWLVDSSYNLIEGNEFYYGTHQCVDNGWQFVDHSIVPSFLGSFARHSWVSSRLLASPASPIKRTFCRRMRRAACTSEPLSSS